ncbi:hypothetical protein Pmani_034604 [Petrolisthes manimaculis]|uniref:Uncharacterized protein n=1 Tax=Petrolisthes manimaculis TaxID=1843537 RepID=A0AAE1NP27_9EUCA|nr:hypothetical protein Pmani_034604 [Petrolisthes manimaculis]
MIRWLIYRSLATNLCDNLPADPPSLSLVQLAMVSAPERLVGCGYVVVSCERCCLTLVGSPYNGGGDYIVTLASSASHLRLDTVLCSGLSGELKATRSNQTGVVESTSYHVRAAQHTHQQVYTVKQSSNISQKKVLRSVKIWTYFALSPFPRRRSRKSCTPGRDSTSSSAPSTPTPTPKTRSVGIQTPVLQRRGLMSGLGDPPSTPSSLRRLKEKTLGAWQASPLVSRRAVRDTSRDTSRESSITPRPIRKAISPPPPPPPPPDLSHSPPLTRRLESLTVTSSRSSLSSHEPPPTPPSSCHSSSLHFDGPPTPSFPRRRHPSDSSLDSEGAHVVHVGAAGMGVGGQRSLGRDVVLREGNGGRREMIRESEGRREMIRESVRMSQCVVWECLPFTTRKRNNNNNNNNNLHHYYQENHFDSSNGRKGRGKKGIWKGRGGKKGIRKGGGEKKGIRKGGGGKKGIRKGGGEKKGIRKGGGGKKGIRKGGGEKKGIRKGGGGKKGIRKGGGEKKGIRKGGGGKKGIRKGGGEKKGIRKGGGGKKGIRKGGGACRMEEGGGKKGICKEEYRK